MSVPTGVPVTHHLHRMPYQNQGQTVKAQQLEGDVGQGIEPCPVVSVLCK